MDKVVAILESQIFWGFTGLILAAMALSGKFSMTASRILLVFAWLIAVVGIYRWVTSSPLVLRILLTMLCASVLGIGLYYLDQWLGPEKKFCYFSLYSIHGKPVVADGKFQLAMTVVGGAIEKVNYWISPWGVLPTGGANDPYYSLDARKALIEIIHEGGRAWDRALPAGDYRIDFSTKNGNWYEHLKLYVENGVVRQSIKVTKELDAGEVLYDSKKER